MKFDHEQVAFVTADLTYCTVDKGLYDILSLLKRLGIRTLFSCENNLGKAYILANGRDCRKFEKLVLRLRSRNLLKIETLEVITNFMTARRETKIFHYTGGGNQEYQFLHRDRRGRSPYLIERSMSFKYGHRMVYRWPHKDSEKVRVALLDISQKLQGS